MVVVSRSAMYPLFHQWVPTKTLILLEPIMLRNHRCTCSGPNKPKKSLHDTPDQSGHIVLLINGATGIPKQAFRVWRRVLLLNLKVQHKDWMNASRRRSVLPRTWLLEVPARITVDCSPINTCNLKIRYLWRIMANISESTPRSQVRWWNPRARDAFVQLSKLLSYCPPRKNTSIDRIVLGSGPWERPLNNSLLIVNAHAYFEQIHAGNQLV